MRERVALALVQSDTLLLKNPHNKDARIRQHPEMLDREMIALLVPWWE